MAPSGPSQNLSTTIVFPAKKGRRPHIELLGLDVAVVEPFAAAMRARGAMVVPFEDVVPVLQTMRDALTGNGSDRLRAQLDEALSGAVAMSEPDLDFTLDWSRVAFSIPAVVRPGSDGRITTLVFYTDRTEPHADALVMAALTDAHSSPAAPAAVMQVPYAVPTSQIPTYVRTMLDQLGRERH